MKVIPKAGLAASSDAVRHALDERLVMEVTPPHRFVLTLRYAFQSPRKLYLCTDYVAGGDLYAFLRRRGRSLGEGAARFVLAELVLGLQHLHAAGVLYRDVKLENILLDASGHVRIADFGLSKLLAAGTAGGGGGGGGGGAPELTRTLCGTKNYCAPEAVRGDAYGLTVDVWAVGVLAYELLCGTTPFDAPDTAAVFARILTRPVEYPPHLSDAAVGLIRGLLVREPGGRLGCGAGGWEDVKAHPFFGGVDWDAVAAGRQTAGNIFASPFVGAAGAGGGGGTAAAAAADGAAAAADKATADAVAGWAEPGGPAARWDADWPVRHRRGRRAAAAASPPRRPRAAPDGVAAAAAAAAAADGVGGATATRPAVVRDAPAGGGAAGGGTSPRTSCVGGPVSSVVGGGSAASVRGATDPRGARPAAPRRRPSRRRGRPTSPRPPGSAGTVAPPPRARRPAAAAASTAAAAAAAGGPSATAWRRAAADATAAAASPAAAVAAAAAAAAVAAAAAAGRPRGRRPAVRVRCSSATASCATRRAAPGGGGGAGGLGPHDAHPPPPHPPPSSPLPAVAAAAAARRQRGAFGALGDGAAVVAVPHPHEGW
ncbi:hypothetical protein BU14_0176s0025 [Porphyra umbilicalis]|uniref:Protein kinase domain-containing protein n=1 Tax=Porphyra umbilicalis TaxID=2786 RepID=A0A1X6P829_PORUM|nr:hypothetical protein BU14_0176s0025 [Porphyra umbilicalis]|eukprot:OSX76783.1 hypothetical protein BU14_0176s0025 [Porphyra umbilicalis]